MPGKKLVFLAIIISIVLLLGGFAYQRIEWPSKNSPEKQVAGIFVGNPKAPLVVQAYISYLCPACASFMLTTYPEIEKNYVLPGKVQFEFFLLPPYDIAQTGLCAQKQGKFMPFSEAAFQKQNFVQTASDLFDFTPQAGLDRDLFVKCLKAQTDFSLVEKWYQQALGKNIISTPTFLIGDSQSLVVGAYTYSVFANLLEQKLKQ